jgi:hypothetical protein
MCDSVCRIVLFREGGGGDAVIGKDWRAPANSHRPDAPRFEDPVGKLRKCPEPAIRMHPAIFRHRNESLPLSGVLYWAFPVSSSTPQSQTSTP